MAKPEASTRPNYGTTTEVKPGTRLITVVNPDGSQTVRQVPVGQEPKPSK